MSTQLYISWLAYTSDSPWLSLWSWRIQKESFHVIHDEQQHYKGSDAEQNADSNFISLKIIVNTYTIHTPDALADPEFSRGCMLGAASQLLTNLQAVSSDSSHVPGACEERWQLTGHRCRPLTLVPPVQILQELQVWDHQTKRGLRWEILNYLSDYYIQCDA